MRFVWSSKVGWVSSVRYYTSSFSWKDQTVLNLDREGRFLSVVFDNGSPDKKTYRRSLDGQWMEIARSSSSSPRKRRILSDPSVQELYQKIKYWVERLQQDIKDQPYSVDTEWNDPLDKTNHANHLNFWLETLGHYSWTKELEQRQKYSQVYSKVGILPPDRYGSVVLQVTEGCVYNKCSFCTFYRGIPYRTKNAGEFKDHVRAVKNFLGESVGRFHSIFLGDANALMVDISSLVEIFDLVATHFPVSSQPTAPSVIFRKKPIFAGIYSFLDVFTGKRKTQEDFRALADKGLRMVYLGLESGSPEVLDLLNKPNREADVLKVVKNLKHGGVAVAPIFLVGPGGPTHTEEHVRKTVDLVKRMNLGPNDLIYLSPMVAMQGSPYSLLDIPSLTSEEVEEQAALMKQKILGLYEPSGGAPKLSRYEIRDFLY